MSFCFINKENVEKDNVEFKLVSQDKIPNDLWETISAFSNADGGIIKLGVDPAGKVVGIQTQYIDKLQQDVYSLCACVFNHRLYPEITVDSYNVISIFIPPVPSSMRPIFSSRRGFPNGGRVRIGSSNVCLDDEWLRRFAIAAKGGAELLDFPGSYIDYFDIKYIERYLQKVKDKRGDVYKSLKRDEILIKLRAVTSEHKITMFGLLAFSNSYGLQELTSPTVNIAITQYAGTSKVNPLDIEEVSIDDREVNGNCVYQFENTLKLIFSKLPIRSRISAEGKRLSYLAIPEVAIREAVANAIAHRDYTTYKGRIQIDIYSDRIEFANPGRSLVAINQLEKTHPETRNPLLMSYLKDLGITEHRGRGISTIKLSLKRAGLAEPRFENTGDSFVATFYSSAFITADDQGWLMGFRSYKLNERQLKALVYLKHGLTTSINNSEYRDINSMGRVGDDIRAKKELAQLVKKGILIAKGENRYRTYELDPSYRGQDLFLRA